MDTSKKCPKCGSASNIICRFVEGGMSDKYREKARIGSQSGSTGLKLFAGLLGLAGDAMNSSKDHYEYECSSCGHKWEEN